jgi:hypothetical protein
MRFSNLLVTASIVGASCLASAEPLEPPTLKAAVQIEHARGGECSEIHAGRAGERSALAMTDICHGWTMMNCLDMVLVRGTGVIEDQAQVLFTDDNRAIDLVPLVDRAIRKKWPDHEHLHLQFGTASCEGESLVMTFSGSHIKSNSTGSAGGLRGVVRIDAPDKYSVSLRVD